MRGAKAQPSIHIYYLDLMLGNVGKDDCISQINMKVSPTCTLCVLYSIPCKKVRDLVFVFPGTPGFDLTLFPSKCNDDDIGSSKA